MAALHCCNCLAQYLSLCANILALAWKDCSAAGVLLGHPIARSLSPLYGSTHPSTIPSIQYHCRALTHLTACCSHHDMLAHLLRREQRRAEWRCASVCSVIAATNSRREAEAGRQCSLPFWMLTLKVALFACLIDSLIVFSSTVMSRSGMLAAGCITRIAVHVRAEINLNAYRFKVIPSSTCFLVN